MYHLFNTDDSLESIKYIKNHISLSTKEVKFLNSKINALNMSDSLKAIILYALWSPDEAIEQARMKGVFRFDQFTLHRYKAVYHILNYLLSRNDILGFSIDTQNYMQTKMQMIKEYRNNWDR